MLAYEKTHEIKYFIKELAAALEQWPHIINEAALVQIHPVVDHAILDKLPEAGELVAVIEKYTPLNSPRDMVRLGREYAFLWALYHREDDYKKAEKYYLLTLSQRPKDVYSLRGISCIYTIHGHPDEIKYRKLADEVIPERLKGAGCEL